MSERHTTRGLQYWREITETGDTRTAAARASDTRPFKPYVYGGETGEPSAVTAARKRHRALNAALEQRLRELEARQAGAAMTAEAMPDPAPGYEWHRELADD